MMENVQIKRLAWFPIALLFGCTEAIPIGNEHPAEVGGTHARTSTTWANGLGGATGTTTVADPFVRGGAPPITNVSTVVNGGASSPTTTGPVECGQPRLLTADDQDAIRSAGCNAWAIEPEGEAVKVQFVVDVSSSMNQTAPGSDRTKWELTRDALIEAITGPASEGGLSPSTSVGLLFYPNQPNDASAPTAPTDTNVCLNTGAEIPMAPLGVDEPGSHRQLLRAKIAEAVLGRGTPTADAYSDALSRTLLSPAQTNVPGDPYLILITDGRPTYYLGCYNPSGQLSDLPGDEIVALAGSAFSNGVRTFVIGSPGSEDARAWLSKAASAGGTARANCVPESASGPYCHLDLTQQADFGTAMRDALANATAPARRCVYELPSESADGRFSVDPSRISVLVNFSDGRVVLLSNNTNAGASCDNGFHVAGSSVLQIESGACARLQDDPQAVVQFVFGCGPDDWNQELI